jgi:hypothetical protein
MMYTFNQIIAIFWRSIKPACDGFGMRHVGERGENDMVLSGNLKK